jgi:hypothetical protein
MRWIQEAECVGIILGNKPYLGQPCPSNPGAVVWLHAQPSHPKELQVDRRRLSLRGSNPKYGSVVNTENLSIPVWVCTGLGFRGADHNKGLGTRIENILITPDVVGGIVDAENLCFIYFIVHDSNGIAIVC